MKAAAESIMQRRDEPLDLISKINLQSERILQQRYESLDF
jgi:hypothetical protein